MHKRISREFQTARISESQSSENAAQPYDVPTIFQVTLFPSRNPVPATAVQRVRDYIRLTVDGKISERPAMATTYKDDFGDLNKWVMPSIVALLAESRKLFENIYQTEIDVQRIDQLTKALPTDEAFDPDSWLKVRKYRPRTIRVHPRRVPRLRVKASEHFLIP